MRFRIPRRAGGDRASLRTGQFCLQRVRDVRRDVAFDREDVSKLSIVSFRPKMRVILGVDQLHMHSHLVTGFAHAAFENVRDAKLLRDIRQMRACTFETLR